MRPLMQPGESADTSLDESPLSHQCRGPPREAEKRAMTQSRKDRPRPPPTFADLRGPRGEAILARSAPHACLSVLGCRGREELGTFVARHDLASTGSRYRDVVHLSCRGRSPGTGEERVVRIFLAALELHLWLPQCHLFLSEVDGLHPAPQAPFSGQAERRFHAPDGKIQSWLENPRPLSLEPAISWHLHRAGFAVDREERVTHLESERIREIFSTFLRSIHGLTGDARAA